MHQIRFPASVCLSVRPSVRFLDGGWHIEGAPLNGNGRAQGLADILLALDFGNLAVLTLLNLSAAFDSVDHDILFWRLHTTYCLGGVVMDWFRSYLNGRTQYGRSSTTSSSPCWIKIRHHLHPHAYADDTQIYGSCIPPNTDMLQERMSVCVDEVSLWMASNRLLLNPTKTEVLWCSSARRQHQIPTGSATRQWCRCLWFVTLGSTLTLT